MKLFYVYILQCSDNTFYTSVTNNLKLRFEQHQSGYNKGSYTYYRRPVELKWHEVYRDILYAVAIEKKIKRWSKAKKMALIDGDFKLISVLAKKRFRYD